jgi:hemerythrin-like metal-binding protein
MSICRWDDSFAVGLGPVDDQHRAFFQMFDELNTAVREQRAQAAIAQTLDRLDDYISSHFAMEEGLMREAKYPYLDQHLVQHEDMRKRSAQLIAGFRAGKPVLTQELIAFLAKWLVEHIREHDRRMVQHVRARRAEA